GAAVRPRVRGRRCLQTGDVPSSVPFSSYRKGCHQVSRFGNARFGRPEQRRQVAAKRRGVRDAGGERQFLLEQRGRGRRLRRYALGVNAPRTLQIVLKPAAQIVSLALRGHVGVVHVLQLRDQVRRVGAQLLNRFHLGRQTEEQRRGELAQQHRKGAAQIRRAERLVRQTGVVRVEHGARVAVEIDRQRQRACGRAAERRAAGNGDGVGGEHFD